MKGQSGPVSNGPKEPINDEEFDSWRSQAHQAFQSYSNPVSANSMGDPYSMQNYYGTMSFPYQNLGLGDAGAWSNGSETMTFLGGYGGQMGNDQHSHYVDSMLGGGGFGGFGQPGFNYFQGNGDYSAWGTSASVGRKPNSHAPHYEDYYRDVYSEQANDQQQQHQAQQQQQQQAQRASMKPVEQGMQGLNLADNKVDSKMAVDCKSDFVKDGMMIGGSGQVGQSNSGGGGGGSGGGNGGGISQAPKKMTWASIASQPAKPQPKIKSKSIPPAPMLPGKHNMDIGTWEGKNGNNMKSNMTMPPSRTNWNTPRGGRTTCATTSNYSNNSQVMTPVTHSNSTVQGGGNSGSAGSGFPAHPVLDRLRQVNEYNPKELDINTKNARFFIIKSYSEDDIHRSIKYGIWCSTEHGNKRLDEAYRDQESKGPLYLFFSVNGSGHFCGMAQMASEVDYNSTNSVWSQDKWKGEFKVKWIYVKDVPNTQLRHIRLENNENKPVTNSRDTQEVPNDKGKQVLKIIHSYRHTTSIFDDFVHYEKRQEEEDMRKHGHTHNSDQQQSSQQPHPPPSQQNRNDGKN